MNEKINIESNIKYSTLIILILGGIGFSFLSYYLTSKSLEADYPQIAGLILGLFFGVFGLLSIISIWQLNKYEFDGERLIVKSIFNTPKTTIYTNSIRSYNEIDKENKHIKWKDLTIFTDRHKIKISSSTISNYHKLKSALTKGIERDEHSEKLWLYKVNKRYGVGFIIIGLLFSIGMLNIYSNHNKEITSDEISIIIGTVSDTLEIDRKNSSKWINLKIKEHPEYVFEISGIRFEASLSNEIVNEIFPGDKIKLSILTDTYQKKITKTKELTFIDKSVNYHFITTNGLSKDGKDYLLLETINQEHKIDSKGWGFWVLLLVGVSILSSGVYLITRKMPAANTVYSK